MSNLPNAPAKRKAVSKRVRFEIFKRDGFACFNNTDLTMVMDKVMRGLKSGQNRINRIIKIGG